MLNNDMWIYIEIWDWYSIFIIIIKMYLYGVCGFLCFVYVIVVKFLYDFVWFENNFGYEYFIWSLFWLE